MSFVISPADTEAISFEIPTEDGKSTVTLSVPYLDSIRPRDLEKITEKMEKEDIDPTHMESTRVILDHIAGDTAAKKKAINALTFRQLSQISDQWNKQTQESLEKIVGFTESSEKSTD